MRLIELPDDGSSLEFSPAETASVMSALRAFGNVSIVHRPTFDLISLNDIQFVYMDEWDEPCLIANSLEGKDLLVRIFQSQTQQEASNADEARKGEPPMPPHDAEEPDYLLTEGRPRRGWWQRTFGN